MTIFRTSPLTAVALGALLVGAISCGSSDPAKSAVETTGGTTGGSTGTTPTPTPTPPTTSQRFVLTPSADTFVGGAGNDTFIGDGLNSGTNGTLNSSDSLDGGAGVDTFEIHGIAAFSVTGLPSPTNTVKSMENVVWVAALTDLAADFTALYSKAVNGVEKYILKDIKALSTKTITTGAGQSLQVSTAGGAVNPGPVTWAGGSSDTALTLTFDGYQYVAGGAPAAFTVTGAAATAMNIVSTGTSNKTAAFTAPATVTNYVITGTAPLDISPASANLLTGGIDASGNSGGSIVDVSAATVPAGFVFKGGAGNDTIRFADGNLATLTAGTQIAMGEGSLDKLSTEDTAFTTTSTTGEIAKINGATGVEVLGLNAAITVDASLLTSINRFAVDTSGLAQTFTNVKSGVIFDLGVGATTNFSQTSLTVGAAALGTPMTINLGGASDTVTHAIAGLTLTGAALSSASGNVTFNFAGTGAKTVTVAAYTATQTFTLNGSAATTFTATASGASTINGSALTGNFTAVASTSADVITGSTTKNNTITPLAGADTVNVSSTGVNVINYTLTAQSATGVFANAGSTTSMDVITGMKTGDTLVLAGTAQGTSPVAAGTSYLTAACTTTATENAFIGGTYDSVAKTFTKETTVGAGADSMLQWCDDELNNVSSINSVILKGYKSGTAPTIAAALITLN